MSPFVVGQLVLSAPVCVRERMREKGGEGGDIQLASFSWS